VVSKGRKKKEQKKKNLIFAVMYGHRMYFRGMDVDSGSPEAGGPESFQILPNICGTYTKKKN
jgi:hypothetical protein